jgi:starch synthase
MAHEPLEQSKIKYIPTVLTVHNLMYSGVVKDENLKKIVFDLDYWNDPGEETTQSIFERKNTLSLLREGLECCDVISTVSPTYAKEISILQESPIGDVLVRRKKSLFGILNGIDTSIWNPKNDTYIQFQYDNNTVEMKKKLNKKHFRHT